MLKNFELSLENLLCQYGLEKKSDAPTKDIQEDSISRHGIPEAKTVPPDKQQQLAGFVSKKDMPNGVGRAAELDVSPALAKMGSLGDILKYSLRLSRDKALSKLGLDRSKQRFLPFGSSNVLNAFKVIGMSLEGLKCKYAGLTGVELETKLAGDRLVFDVLKLANSLPGKLKMALSVGIKNLEAAEQLLHGVFPLLAAGGFVKGTELTGYTKIPKGDTPKEILSLYGNHSIKPEGHTVLS